MKRKRIVFLVCILLISIVITIKGAELNLYNKKQTLGNPELEVSTDNAVYELGEPVTIFLTNIGDDTLSAGGPIITIYNSDNVIVYQLAAYCWYELDPGEYVTWIPWNQTDQQGNQVPTGKYTVEGFLSGYNQDFIDTSIFYIVDINIPVEERWNFISLPYNQIIQKQDILIRYNNVDYTWSEATTSANPMGTPLIDTNIFLWDKTNQIYSNANEFKPGEGYWIYSYYDCEIIVESIDEPYNNQITDIETQWNLIGIPYYEQIQKTDIIIDYNGQEYTWSEATNPINGPIIDQNILGWNAENQIYEIADILSTGQAYWIYSYYDCNLLI